jgi:hypothetical protein
MSSKLHINLGLPGTLLPVSCWLQHIGCLNLLYSSAEARPAHNWLPSGGPVATDGDLQFIREACCEWL